MYYPYFPGKISPVIKKLLLILLFLFVAFLIPQNSFAQEQFNSSYNVTYDISETGSTTVSEQVTLKNLTERYFASSFNLTIGATEISNVTAFDTSGPLKVTSKKAGNKTEINVEFSKQIVGKDKEYTWTLQFNSGDFAQKQGKVWQVSVPKVSSASDITSYNLALQVPVAFGDPTSIIPEPLSTSETGGKLRFNFNKDQLKDSGILANFGQDQVFDFDLGYEFENPGFLPALASVALPSNTDFQQVIINEINPTPDNVTVDADGNSIAWFKVGRKENLKIRVKGLAKLFINKQQKIIPLSESQRQTLTSEQKYWDTSNPAIKTKLGEILGAGTDTKTNQDKASLINKFVVDTLKYDEARLKSSNFERLGAITALSNPEKAMCSEFTDLFITLAREAGIPTRQLVGYAYTSNTSLRPISFDDVMHTWPEYYDERLGWIMIDPTWQNTTGGVDYFSKFDLNHLVLAKRGANSEEPYLPDDVTVKFSEAEFAPTKNLSIELDAPSEFFAGFPSAATLRVQNKGNYTEEEKQLSLSSSKIEIKNNTFTMPSLPPGGKFEYKFDLRTGTPLESYEDVLVLRLGDEVVNKRVVIKPFFAHRVFAIAVAFVTVSIASVYIAVLFLHLKRTHKSK